MRFIFTLFISCLCLSAFAQDPTPPSELEGPELRDWLRLNWYLPWHDDLGYSEARVEMYSTIDVEDGLIECVYSGFTQPATFNSFPDPINTEHTVPQSYFDSQTPMRSDIHHLFPTHGQANGTRGNLSYGEVVDSQADEWLIGSAGNYSETSNIPSSNIDDYSEIKFNVFFEPREENKGNTARAIFYFYTMYADDLVSGFEDISAVCDLATIYDWHVMDPPDAQEIERDEEIQAVQGNYNPYVRMPQLAAPAWGFVSSVDEAIIDIQVQQDMASGIINILSSDTDLTYRLTDYLGRTAIPASPSKRIYTSSLDSGIYLIIAEGQHGERGIKKVFVR